MKYVAIKIIMVTCLLSMTILTNYVQAQVTIGSGIPPVKAALLDIKTQQADADNITSNAGGLGLPRVQLVNKYTLEPFIKATDPEWDTGAQEATKKGHAGLMVYNLKTDSSSGTDQNFSEGIYVWNGTQWNFINESSGQRYFFIPSFNISLAGKKAGDTGIPVDLYKEYKKQFTQPGNTTFVSSNTLLTQVPSPGFDKLYEAGELDYVITYYDTNIMEDVTVSAAGILNYKIKSTETTPASFINVVFVIK